MEEENATLHLTHSSIKKLQALIKEEVESLGGAMAMVYEYMMRLHHTITHILSIQADTKDRSFMLKEATIVLENINEWTNRYAEALRTLLKKY